MFDILGKAIGGLTQLAQEKLLFDFLRSDPGMAFFVGGLVVLVLIIVPIGPAWMRTVSWIGKLLAATGALSMIAGILILGLDYSIAKVEQLHKATQSAQKPTSGAFPIPVQGIAPKIPVSENGG